MLNKKQKFFFFFLFFVFFIFSANFTLAFEFRAPEINYPQLPFPGVLSPQFFLEEIKEGRISGEQAFPLYVKYFYYLFLMIAGLLALGVIIYGGFLYLISAGAPVKMIAAKEQITGGILGFVILLSSYLILATISPQLVILRLPGLEKITLPEIKLSEPGEKKLPTYFQIPLGMIIENAAVNEEGQGKLNNSKMAAEDIRIAAENLRNLTEQLKNLAVNSRCGTSKCNLSTCTGISCPESEDNKEKIAEKTKEINQAIKTLEEKQEMLWLARLPLLYDLLQLRAAGALMSLASGVFNYGTRLNLHEIEITTFPGWEDINTKVNSQIVKNDPVTFYFYEPRNKGAVQFAQELLWEGDNWQPPEDWTPPDPIPGALQWPLEVPQGWEPPSGKEFGACRDGCTNKHAGIDITKPRNTLIRTAAEGIVIGINTDSYGGGYGNWIIIYHEELNLSTLYAHLQRVGVSRGESVEAGQVIGTVGNTGTSTGPHLHFEVYPCRLGAEYIEGRWMVIKNCNPVNPMVGYLP